MFSASSFSQTSFSDDAVVDVSVSVTGVEGTGQVGTATAKNIGVKAPPKHQIPKNGDRLRDHEGQALSVTLRHPVNGRYHQKAGAECRYATE